MRQLDLSGPEWTVTFPDRTNPALIAVVKQAGGRWHSIRRSWQIPPSGQAATVLAELAADHGFDVIGGDLDELTGGRQSLAALSTALDFDLTGLLTGVSPEVAEIAARLKPHQRVGVAYALTASRALIADAMGLGKTPTALVALAIADQWPAVIAVPRTLVSNWCVEATRWLPDGTRIYAVLAPSTPVEDTMRLRHRGVGVHLGVPRPVGQVYVVPYSMLGDTAVALARFDPAAVVFDESQVVKTPLREWVCAICLHPAPGDRCTGPTAHRVTGDRRIHTYSTRVVRAAKHLATGVVDRDGLVFALSGTPNKNRPTDLIAQLDILGQLDQFGGRESFVHRYAAGIDPDAATRSRRRTGTNLIELNTRLKATCMVRRRTADVLPGIGLERHQLLVDLHPDDEQRYQDARADVAAFLAARARQIAEEEGLEPGTEALRARMRAEAGLHLVRLGTLLGVAARAKVPMAVDWVREFLDQTDRKVVVFAHHRAVVKALAAELGCERIDGDTGDSMPIVDRFQNNPNVRVVVVGIMAGGVGLTLTAASDMLFLEQAWTPADLDQCEGRCFGRVNDAHSATATYMLAAGTEDERVAAMLDRKRAEFHAVADGVVAEDAGEVAADLLDALLDPV